MILRTITAPFITAALIIAFAFSIPVNAASVKLQIISSKSAPVKINEYETKFKPIEAKNKGGILHIVHFKNISKSDIVEAVQFGIISYDVFTGFQNRAGAVSTADLMPGASEKVEWCNIYDNAFMFGHAFIFVVKVKYTNGAIWEFNSDEVISKITEVFPDFNPAAMLDKDFRFLPAE